MNEERTGLPAPGWDPVTVGYWTAAGEGRLAVPQCADCGRHRWPPTWACYACQSREWKGADLQGSGKVFSYTWADQRADPDSPLYNIAVIELDGTEGEPVRLMTRVIEVDKDSLRIDLPVRVAFEPFDSEV